MTKINASLAPMEGWLSVCKRWEEKLDTGAEMDGAYVYEVET